jgi:hypothetical protein
MKRLLVQDSEAFTKAQNEIDVMVTTTSSSSRLTNKETALWTQEHSGVL